MKTLLQQTETAMGGTNRSYTQLINRLGQEKKLHYATRPIPGQMIFFRYEPATQKFVNSPNTYYDIFPLVLITDVRKEGFEGINFHYLDPESRMFLLNQLKTTLPSAESKNWKKRLVVEYSNLRARRRLKFFRPCYRKYLWGGVEKVPVMIPFEYWNDVCGAELGAFVGRRKPYVYRESIKIINRENS